MLTHFSKQIGIGIKAAIILVSAVCLCAVLSGCSSQEPNQESSEPKTANVGEEVPVKTDNGELDVTVQGFVIPESVNEYKEAYIDQDSNVVGVLKLQIKNVDYELKNTTTTSTDGKPINISPDIYTTDSDDVSMEPMNSTTSYSNYEVATGGYYFSDKGRTDRVAVFYEIDPSLESVNVHLGNTVVTVPVEKE